MWTYRSDLGLAVNGHDALLDTVHVEDGGLGIVDDGGSKHGAKDAGVADGVVAALEILHGQLAIAGLDAVSEVITLVVLYAHLLGQGSNLTLQLDDVQGMRVSQHRRNKALGR